MKNIMQAVGIIVVMVLIAGNAGAQDPGGPGTEEFGLTPKQLVQSIEKVEALISKCMRDQGFQYVAADYITVRRGMSALQIFSLSNFPLQPCYPQFRPLQNGEELHMQ